MTLEKVDSPEPSYRLLKTAEIVNWFDKDELDPSCFSIKDTLGSLLQHPEAGKIVNALLAQARKARGDVAESASTNPALQKLLAAMPLESLLKQAAGAIPENVIRSLNATLQRIPKPRS